MERSPSGCAYFRKGTQKWEARVTYKKKNYWLGSYETKKEAQQALNVFREAHRPRPKKKYDMFSLVPDKIFEFNVGCICNYYECICHNTWAHFQGVYGDEEVFYPDEKTMAGGRRLA